MATELKIGMIGLDTSHAPAFTQILNDKEQPYYVPGGRVVVAFPGGSPDFELSHSRVEGFTNQLRDEFQVEMLDSPEAVAKACDAILLTSVDGRAHLPLFKAIAPSGKPVFIDKPFTTSSADAEAIVQLAQEHNVKLMCSSSLRYAQPLVEALENGETIIGADCFGPMSLQPTQPGYFWYGVHTIEMLYAVLGRGCVRVTAVPTQDHDVITGVWSDGRIGTVRGSRVGKTSYGVLLHGMEGPHYVAAYPHPKPLYASLLERIMPMFQGGDRAIPIEDTLEIVRFIDAANESRESGLSVAL